MPTAFHDALSFFFDAVAAEAAGAGRAGEPARGQGFAFDGAEATARGRAWSERRAA